MWLSTELVGVLTGEWLPWFVLYLLLRILLPTLRMSLTSRNLIVDFSLRYVDPFFSPFLNVYDLEPFPFSRLQLCNLVVMSPGASAKPSGCCDAVTGV